MMGEFVELKEVNLNFLTKFCGPILATRGKLFRLNHLWEAGWLFLILTG